MWLIKLSQNYKIEILRNKCLGLERCKSSMKTDNLTDFLINFGF